jgi:hypothetical protein
MGEDMFEDGVMRMLCKKKRVMKNCVMIEVGCGRREDVRKWWRKGKSA